MTINNNFVSITELQKNTKKSLGNIDAIKRKVILSNNKPQAIIISLGEFEKLTKYETPIKPDEWEKNAIHDYKNSTNKGQGREAKSFLEEIMKK